jgi:3-oxoacyl-[acyl-carrier protein] reductase
MALPSPLRGRVAYITGSTRGIGRATAHAFAKAGASVVVNGRSSGAAVQALAQELNSEYGSPSLGVHVDQTDSEAAADAFRQIHQTFGRLDVLVNNAGILDDALIGMISDSSIDSTFGVNAVAVVRNLQFGAKLMRRSGGGSIINVSSIIGVRGNAGEVVYGASKAAVIGITKSAAKELAPYAIRVNAIAPGFIDTDLTRHLSPDVHEDWVKRIGMGRIGLPEDVADVAVFLGSDSSRYVTGQVIGVDGALVV